MSEVDQTERVASTPDSTTLVHVDSSGSSGGAAETADDAGLRRRRRRSASSDASDAYIEDLLRPWRAQGAAPGGTKDGADAEAASSYSGTDQPAPGAKQGGDPPSLAGDSQEEPHEPHERDDAEDDAAAAGGRDPLAASAGEERMCRICFDGPDEELGKLFSPCLCRGTVRLVASDAVRPS